MTLCTADFELGNNAVTITTGDVGSATAWSDVTIAATASVTYSNVQHIGALSARLTAGGTTGQTYLDWLSGALGVITDHYGRMYIYIGTLPPEGDFNFVNFDSPFVAYMRMVIASRLVAIKDSLDVGVTSTVPLTASSWNRIEWHVVHSATVGQVQAKLFVGANFNGTTPDETITSAANLNTGASINEIYFGMIDNRSSYTLYLDSIVAGAPDYPGPWRQLGLSDAPAAGILGRGAGW